MNQPRLSPSGPILPDEGGVISVFGRTGTVVAEDADYDSSQIANDSSVPGDSVSDALDFVGSKATQDALWFASSGPIELTDEDTQIEEMQFEVRAGKKYALSWGLTFTAADSLFSCMGLISFFLGVDPGPEDPGDIALGMHSQYVILPVGLTNQPGFETGFRASSSGSVPLIGTGAGPTPTPIAPGTYYIKMRAREYGADTGKLSINNDPNIRPNLQILETPI